jgi:hypothetical protein
MAVAGALVQRFEHDLWAKLRLLDCCATLDDERLDARPAPTAARHAGPLIPVIDCSTERRARAATILSQRGIAAPDRDGWAVGPVTDR